MRPKKRILLAGADELRLSALRLVLFTRGFTVQSSTSVEEIAGMLPRGWDLLLCHWPIGDGHRLLQLAHDRALPTLVMADTKTAPDGVFASRVLLRASIAEVVETAKTLSARKRGPRPAYLRDQTATELFAAGGAA